MAEVLRRDLVTGTFEGATCLAVTETAEGQVATFLSGASADRLSSAFLSVGGALRLAGSGFLGRVPAGLPATPAETTLLEGRRSLLALQRGPTTKN